MAKDGSKRNYSHFGVLVVSSLCIFAIRFY